MRKRINTLNASLLLNGVSYGEHVMNPGMVVEDVENLSATARIPLSCAVSPTDP